MLIVFPFRARFVLGETYFDSVLKMNIILAMTERDGDVDTLPEFNFSFLNEISDDNLMDMNGALHLLNHYYDHRGIKGISLEKVAGFLECNEKQISIAREIVKEYERTGKRAFVDLPEGTFFRGVVETAKIFNEKFSEKSDREDSNWRIRAEQNLQKLRNDDWSA